MRIGFVILSCAICAGQVFAQGGTVSGLSAAASLSSVIQRANLIAVGSGGVGLRSGKTVTFPLKISRVIQGDASLEGSTLTVDWKSAAPSGTAVPGTRRDGIWFLQSSPTGWSVIPLTNGFSSSSDLSFPVPSGTDQNPYAYQATAALTDKIASELAFSIENSAVGGSNPNLLMLQSGDGLDQLNSPFVTTLYQRMSVSNVPQQQILGLSGLIRQGNGSAITTAATLGSQLSAYPLHAHVLLSSISLEFRQSDQASVAVLGQAAISTTNPSLPFREACADALRSIHTQASLPFLAALLDDPDVNLQSSGVGGLSSFANGLPIQTRSMVPSLGYLQRPPASTAPFQTAETIANQAMGPQAYTKVAFWKAWWASNHVALGY